MSSDQHKRAGSPKVGSPFLRLPPELRTCIYHLILTADPPIEQTFSNLSRPQQAPLTLIHRFIRSETLAVFYGTNTIRLPVGTNKQRTLCIAWLDAITPHFKLIRRLEIRVCGHQYRYVLERLDDPLRFGSRAELLSPESRWVETRLGMRGVVWLRQKMALLNKALRTGDTGVLQMSAVVDAIFWDATRKF